MNKNTYLIENLISSKKLCFSNTRLAFDVYRHLCLDANVEFYPYATFKMKVRALPLPFLTYVISRVDYVETPNFLPVEHCDFLRNDL